MIARTSSILSSAIRSTGRSPPRRRCGLNSHTRASPGGYTWASCPANHSSRRSRSRLLGRGVDLPVRQRETVCGVVSRSCAISRALMPPDSLMLSSFRATAVATGPPSWSPGPSVSPKYPHEIIQATGSRPQSDFDRDPDINLVLHFGIQIHVDLRRPNTHNQGIPHRSVIVL